MKKQFLLTTTALFSAGIIVFTGCKKDDTTGPVITLTGSATEQSILNAAYTDKGATANDDQDGVVTVTTTGTVNIDLAGLYTLTYSASDAAGNTTTATRAVTVYNEAQTWAGTFAKATIIDSTFGDALHTNYTGLYPWTNNCVITASTTHNKVLIIDPFLNYSNIAAAEKIMGTVTGTTIAIVSQTAHGIGTNSHDHTFQGNGSLLSSTPAVIIRFVTSDLDITGSATAYDIWTITK